VIIPISSGASHVCSCVITGSCLGCNLDRLFACGSRRQRKTWVKVQGYAHSHVHGPIIFADIIGQRQHHRPTVHAAIRLVTPNVTPRSVRDPLRRLGTHLGLPRYAACAMNPRIVPLLHYLKPQIIGLTHGADHLPPRLMVLNRH
jgi:hypothetical protein